MLGITQTITWGILYYGFSTFMPAIEAGLVGAMQVVGRIILGVLGDRVPLRVNASVALALQPPALLSILHVPGLPRIVAFVVLVGAVTRRRDCAR